MGELVTHDDPHHAATELLDHQAAMRAIALLPFVWYRAENGVQYKALVLRVFHPECASLYVLGDGDVPLISRFGIKTTEPFISPRVRRGTGKYMWSTDLDP